MTKAFGLFFGSTESIYLTKSVSSPSKGYFTFPLNISSVLVKGWYPNANMNPMQPSIQISALVPISPFNSIISGALYIYVVLCSTYSWNCLFCFLFIPLTLKFLVNALPKSHNFHESPTFMMFSGLMSKWVIPIECNYFRDLDRSLRTAIESFSVKSLLLNSSRRVSCPS